MTSQKHAPIVVGVDGSADARSAVDYAAWEADRRHLRLRLVHGFATPTAYGPTGFYVYDMQIPTDGAEAMLHDTAREVRDRYPGLDIDTAVVAGAPAGVLVDESRDATLVVVGSRGRGGFLGLLAGSVSAQVAAHAHAPVIVIRPPVHGATRPDVPGTGEVVVGVDGSPGSAAAIEFAFQEAAARGSGLIAVYAWDQPPTTNLGPITSRHYQVDEAQAEADRVLAEALAGWPDKYPDVPVRHRAVHSLNAVRTLIDEGPDAALIVVGPRGRGGFAGLLLGSTGDGLVHHAHRPVAIVHTRPTT